MEWIQFVANVWGDDFKWNYNNLFLDMCPNCAAFYGNRSATYMMIGQYDKALEDARHSVQIDPSFIKVWEEREPFDIYIYYIFSTRNLQAIPWKLCSVAHIYLVGWLVRKNDT